MSAVQRAFGIIELLSGNPSGIALGQIAARLDIPQSAAHRLLTELTQLGYVKRGADSSLYALSIKSVNHSLSYLSKIDLVDLAKGSVERLATTSKGLARLGILDDNTMLWVLKAQGSTSNIRYEPPMNYEVQLSCSAAGFAWLSQLPDERALELVLRQGIRTDGFGRNAPSTVGEFIDELERTRRRGFAYVVDMYENGISSVAMPIINSEIETVVGVLSVANMNMHMSESVVSELAVAIGEETGVLADARLDYARYLLPVRRE